MPGTHAIAQARASSHVACSNLLATLRWRRRRRRPTASCGRLPPEPAIYSVHCWWTRRP